MKLEEGDVPQHLYPALCLASEMMMRNAKKPKGMINFFETYKTQIDSAFGDGLETFLEISGERTTASGVLAPPCELEWRRQLRIKDYTTKETEYIHSIWEMAANTFQSIDREDAISSN